MHKKTAYLLSVSIIAVLILVACQPPATITELDCVKAEVVCVGVVAELKDIDNGSANQSAWEGVRQAQAENIVAWSRYIETVDSKDYYQNITSLAEASYDIIVTVGEQNAEVTSMAADHFPEILFIGVDQPQAEERSNVAGLVFYNDQTGFLAGALAAQITKTGTVTGIFGSDLDPSTVAYKEGFEAGARYINPQINIISSYRPADLDSEINDSGWGLTFAAQAIENGADVVFSAGGKAGKGALLEAANHPGVYCIGVDYDQWETFQEAHPCLLSSAMGQISQGVSGILERIAGGKFPSGNYFGVSGLAPYHDFDTMIPETVKDKIASISTGLGNSTITTGVTAP